MKAFISIIKIRFNLLLQYRIAAIAGGVTQFFFGMIMIMVLYGFYNSSDREMPISYQSAITYIWMGQAMLGMLPWNGDSEIQTLIRTGNVSYELLRPMNLYNYWFARAFALRTAPTLLKSIPIFIIAILLPSDYALSVPPSVSAFIGWIITSFGALMISCTITNIINITTLYSISGDGIQRLLSSIVTLFSGMVVPLPLFPERLKEILGYLPFSGLVDIPARFFTGDIAFGKLLGCFGFQCLWAALLYILGQWILNRKIKDLIVQGG
ncbi:MAG: ABC-2 family transporter protein [Tissierellaceae bacterium]|nr:ABC-2 family transporter protein [Tissierellaceae bacterium]